MEKIICSGDILVDENGRQRIFRGFNLCFKNPTKCRLKRLDVEKAVEICKKNGFNLIRFGINWSSIEPKEQEYDDEFISIVQSIGKSFEENEIYFFLDIHQDVWGKAFINGAPEWATHTDGYNPKKFLAVWPEGYFYMSAVTNAFHHFWNNDYNLIDRYAQMWRRLIDAFDGNTALLGYDFMNEPYPTPNGRKIFLKIIENVFYELDGKRIDYSSCFNSKYERLGFVKMVLKILLRVKSVKRFKRVLDRIDNKEVWSNIVNEAYEYVREFDVKYYSPFIKRMNDEFPERPAIFEHTYYSNMGIPFSAEKPSENSIYSPHGYDLWVDTPMYKNSSNNRVDVIFEQCRKNQERMNVPVIVGEWGAGASGDKWYPHIEHIMEIFEKYQWSFTYWGLMFGNDELCKIVARPYPVAVNGRITEFSSRNNHFTLEYESGGSNEADTLVFDGKKIRRFKSVSGTNKIEFDY